MCVCVCVGGWVRAVCVCRCAHVTARSYSDVEGDLRSSGIQGNGGGVLSERMSDSLVFILRRPGCGVGGRGVRRGREEWEG